MRRRHNNKPMEQCASSNCSNFCKKGDIICNFCVLKRYELEPDVPSGDHPLDESSYSEDKVCDALRQAELFGKAVFANMF